VAFHGNNGILIVDRGGWEILAETDKTGKRSREYRIKPTPPQPGSRDYHFEHVKNFIECVKSRGEPRSDVEIGHHSMKAPHLANIALRMNRKILWNDDDEKIPDDPEAQKMVTAHYRAPWRLP
jgi:hypothetical protein